MSRWFSLVVALVIVLGRGMHAQTVQVRALNGDGARAALSAAIDEARRNQWGVSIAVVDASGALMAFHRLDNSHPASVDLSIGKARTSARFRRPSKAIEDLVAQRQAFLALDGVTPIEGGVPIVVEGVVVGAVGVSGVTSQQDAQVAKAGADAVATGATGR
jgi:glc operon protein GlcG